MKEYTYYLSDCKLKYQNTMITGKIYLISERSHKIKIDAHNKYKHKVGCQINSRLFENTIFLH